MYPLRDQRKFLKKKKPFSTLYFYGALIGEIYSLCMDKLNKNLHNFLNLLYT